MIRLLAAALVLLCAGTPAWARDFTIALRAGFAAAALDDVYVRAFAESGRAEGAKVETASWEGGMDALRAAVAGGPAWDVVLLTGAELQEACEAGLLEKLDWTAIGGRDRMLPQGATDCGMGAAMRATILSWDREKHPAAPGWQDFWDVVKVPGKRGLRQGVRGNLEFALMADGVAPADVYRTLRTEAGVDRAFRKLDQLRPYLVWWQTDEEAMRILAGGEVLMTSAPSPEIAEANRAAAATPQPRSFGLQWAGGLPAIGFWAIPKGAANAALAVKFLAFATDPKLGAKLPGLAFYGGLAKGANDGLPAEQLAVSPTAPAALQVELPADEAFWKDNLDKLSQRFNAWLGR